jgi:mannitol-1-phosphate 5-dehydrogenase
MRQAVQFGAGKIGRGFFGELLSRSGYEIVFVDVRQPLINSLNRHRAYSIRWIDGTSSEIKPVRAFHLEQETEIADVISHAEIIGTSVGVHALPGIASPLARGLFQWALRHPPPETLNILIGENDFNAHETLRQGVEARLPAEHRSLLSRIGFSRCVVSRMVFEELPGDPPIPRAEKYPLLPVDADGLKGAVPAIEGLQPVRPFEAHMRRKLYLHNGIHAMLAYLGFQKGYHFIHEAMADPEIYILVEHACLALKRAFLKAYSLNEAEHQAMTDDLLSRFADPNLQDPIRRVAHEPLRKLRPEDRLVGAAHFIEVQGEEAEPFLIAIRAALLYQDPEDPETVQLAARMECEGMERVFESLYGALTTQHSPSRRAT